MIVPALKEEGYLPLNVLGYGWQTTISSFSATISLPGELNTEPIIYSGDYGADGNYADAKIEKSAEHEYRVTALDLYNYSYNNTAAGITVDFSFQAGVLKANADLPILYAYGTEKDGSVSYG